MTADVTQGMITELRGLLDRWLALACPKDEIRAICYKAEQALTARSEQPTPDDVPEVMDQDFINIISLQSCTHNEFEELRDTARAYHTKAAEIERLIAERGLLQKRNTELFEHVDEWSSVACKSITRITTLEQALSKAREAFKTIADHPGDSCVEYVAYYALVKLDKAKDTAE